MHFYPAGETIARRLLDLPQQQLEWVITGAGAEEVIAAGFQRDRVDETRFIHPESGDIYQLARHHFLDEQSGQLRYQCNHQVTLENELATRALTILAMASDGDTIIDPFDGQEDMIDGILRHVTPYFVYVPQNLLTTAIWATRLKRWGFRLAHSTFGLMKKMIRSGALDQIQQGAIGDAVVQAMATQQPSELFSVLHRCGALRQISTELDDMFEAVGHDQPHATAGLPGLMQSLDQVAAETENVASVINRFYALLADDSGNVFNDLGLSALLDQRNDNDN